MLKLEPQKFASWDEPIDMLYACHGRVKDFCRQLSILPDYLDKNGVNQAVKNDVQQILNYFNQAAPLHHDDEEKDFFPALAQQLPEAQKKIDELEKQHVHLHSNWDRLSTQLQQLLAGDVQQLDRQLVADFIAGYDMHIALEEPLFELGRQHLEQEQLKAMGKIMAARRQA